MGQNRQILGGTKAGRRFMGFMRVINVGDAEAIKQLAETTITDEALEKHSAEMWAAQLQYIHTVTGGLRVQQVLVTDEHYVAVLMEAQADGRHHVIEMYVSDDYPHKVASLVQRMAQDRG